MAQPMAFLDIGPRKFSQQVNVQMNPVQTLEQTDYPSGSR
jgi:hypothetical protein